MLLLYISVVGTILPTFLLVDGSITFRFGYRWPVGGSQMSMAEHVRTWKNVGKNVVESVNVNSGLYCKT